MGSFSNGRTAALGQIALANFANIQGLQRVGNNYFSLRWPPGRLWLARLARADAEPSPGARWSCRMSTLPGVFGTDRGPARLRGQRRTITTFDQVMQDTINIQSPA